MTTFAPDEVVAAPRVAVAYGLVLAVLSAVSFSLSGPLGRGLFATGWTTGGVLIFRTGVGALVLTPLAVTALRGRWRTALRHWRLIAAYALVAVVITQFAYFSAVQRMDVAPALLMEYMGPILVVAWMWLRHGQRPGRLTIIGAVTAVAGLVLVLDLVGGARVDPVGLAWAALAMVGCAAYFVLNATGSADLPPLALAWLGLIVGTVLLGLLCLVGAIPFAMGAGPAAYGRLEVPWWVVALGLGAITCAVAYGSGIVASRRLGSRLSSFLGLLEVVFAVVFAWLLLGQVPGVVQALGGIVVLAGLVAIQQGERTIQSDQRRVGAS